MFSYCAIRRTESAFSILTRSLRKGVMANQVNLGLRALDDGATHLLLRFPFADQLFPFASNTVPINRDQWRSLDPS